MSTDQELVARAKDGDTAAFADVWRRYDPRVTSLCQSYLPSAQPDPAMDEADLATEVFVRALHQLDRYEDRSDAGAGFEA